MKTIIENVYNYEAVKEFDKFYQKYRTELFISIGTNEKGIPIAAYKISEIKKNIVVICETINLPFNEIFEIFNEEGLIIRRNSDSFDVFLTKVSIVLANNIRDTLENDIEADFGIPTNTIVYLTGPNTCKICWQIIFNK